MSLDALRGFDMFWIVGGGAVVTALNRAGDHAWLQGIRHQLEHVAWDGFRFYDLIFPLFVFISGVSAVFSLAKAKERGGVGEAARRVVLRGLLLFGVGVFYSGGLSRGWDEIRWLGVLQRIALSYVGAGLLFLALPARALYGAWAGLLLGYWAILGLVPVRDIALDRRPMAELMQRTGETNARTLYQAATHRVRNVYDPGRNVAHHFDFRHLPGRRYDVYWDPEGVVSTLGGVASCLLGVLAGRVLRDHRLGPASKTVRLGLAGVACVGAGLAWSTVLPVIKKIWTPSFVLVAGGCSLGLLALFHQLVDGLGWRRWCQPFVWIGTNALTVYLAANILGASGGFAGIAGRVLGGPV
ncbi:MAG: acyltransferase family protein, partial [Verrucomicrobiota bacterium]